MNVKQQRKLDGYLSTSKYGMFDFSDLCLLGKGTEPIYERYS
jgi:hypothetical protein